MELKFILITFLVYFSTSIAVSSKTFAGACEKENEPIKAPKDFTPCDSECMRVKPDFIKNMETCQAAFKKPVRITSGCRPPERNKRAGGQPNSNHLYGTALDLVPNNGDCEALKKQCEATLGVHIPPCHHGSADHVHLNLEGSGPKNEPCKKDKDSEECKRTFKEPTGQPPGEPNTKPGDGPTDPKTQDPNTTRDKEDTDKGPVMPMLPMISPSRGGSEKPSDKSSDAPSSKLASRATNRDPAPLLAALDQPAPPFKSTSANTIPPVDIAYQGVNQNRTNVSSSASVISASSNADRKPATSVAPKSAGGGSSNGLKNSSESADASLREGTELSGAAGLVSTGNDFGSGGGGGNAPSSSSANSTPFDSPTLGKELVPVAGSDVASLMNKMESDFGMQGSKAKEPESNDNLFERTHSTYIRCLHRGRLEGHTR